MLVIEVEAAQRFRVGVANHFIAQHALRPEGDGTGTIRQTVQKFRDIACLGCVYRGLYSVVVQRTPERIGQAKAGRRIEGLNRYLIDDDDLLSGGSESFDDAGETGRQARPIGGRIANEVGGGGEGAASLLLRVG